MLHDQQAFAAPQQATLSLIKQELSPTQYAYRIIWRSLLLTIALLLTVWLTACGQQATPHTADPTDAGSQHEQGITTDDAQPAREPFLYEHTMGITEIPGKPERIYAIQQTYMYYLLDLGVVPYAGTTTDGEWPPLIAEQLTNTIPMGDSVQSSIEAVLDIAPDLIIGYGREKALSRYEMLSKAAPTVFLDRFELPWRDLLREIAVIVDKEEVAEQVLAQFETELEAAKADIAQLFGDDRVAVMRFHDKGMRLYNEKKFGLLFDDLGLNNVPIQTDEADTQFMTVSWEGLLELNPQHIFVFDEPTLREKWEELNADHLWNSIDAVKSGNVHIVNFDNWFYGESAIGYRAMLRDITALSQQ